MRNVQWIEGIPDDFDPGMILMDDDGDIFIVGNGTDPMQESIWRRCVKAWAWLIQPYQREWLEDMAKRHKTKAR